MNETFRWSRVFETGVGIVDEQHRWLIRLINEAAPILSDPALASAERLTALLDELVRYATQHFRDEEALMVEKALAPEFIATQVQQHRDFTGEVKAMRAQETGTIPDSLALLRFLTSWLAFHILGTDQLMAEQIRLIESGTSAEKAYEAARQPHDIAAVRPLLDAMNSLHEIISSRNRALKKSNATLRAAQAELKANNEELEVRVAARTAELEREKAELAAVLERMERTQGQLLQSEKMASIGQLAAGVAHEINNPVGFVNSNLGTLKTYVERLLGLLDVYAETEVRLPDDPALRRRLADAREKADLDYLRDDIRDLLRESQEGLGRVKRIVSDLKDFSHVDEADWHDADLNAGLESTLNVVWNELKYKAQVVRQLGEIPAVRCIPAQINQIFMNLLVNAAQAIDTHGTITLTTRCEGEQVVVEIADTGKGIPPEIQSRIFEPFFTTKPVGKGTGLGLSISWDIMQKHGGRISVRSVPGQGTTFTLRLPVRGPGEAG